MHSYMINGHLYQLGYMGFEIIINLNGFDILRFVIAIRIKNIVIYLNNNCSFRTVEEIALLTLGRNRTPGIKVMMKASIKHRNET